MHNLSPFFLAVLGIIGVVLCCCLCRSCFCHYKKICKRSRKASQGLLVESTSSTTSSSPLDRLSGMDSTATSSRFGNNRYYSTFSRGVHFAEFSWVLFAIYTLYVHFYQDRAIILYKQGLPSLLAQFCWACRPCRVIRTWLSGGLSPQRIDIGFISSVEKQNLWKSASKFHEVVKTPTTNQYWCCWVQLQSSAMDVLAY